MRSGSGKAKPAAMSSAARPLLGIEVVVLNEFSQNQESFTTFSIQKRVTRVGKEGQDLSESSPLENGK